MKEVVRREYIDLLKKWKDEKVIKVVTGIRRCGKSTLLKQYEEYLKNSGVDSEQIISINFEDLEYEELQDYKKLYEYLKTKLVKGKTSYIFLDEIQKVSDFEKVVDSLYIKENIDIYITGSNSYMLSGDLATYLTGRYIEIKMLPLSLKEFVDISSLAPEKALSEYMIAGGLPYVAHMCEDSSKINFYLEGIYNTVIVKDIEDRQERKELEGGSQKITDILLLKTIAKYLCSIAGSLVSVRSITNYLTSNGRKVSQNTINNYLEALTESFIFYPVDRIDVVGKQVLQSNKKYYVVDLGLRNYILPRQHYDLGFSLENIVYFELLRRGNELWVGKAGNTEVDFVAKKDNVYTYYQVTADMTAEETFNREITPLKNIKDNYEKIILTGDRYTVGNYEGIKVINILDWLTK